MAGRGTDIKVRRSEVIEVGGLCVIWDERMSQDVLTNQLRGRAETSGIRCNTIYLPLKDDPDEDDLAQKESKRS